MNDTLTGIYLVIKRALIFSVLPIWYIGACNNNKLSKEQKAILGIMSVLWVVVMLVFLIDKK